MIDIQNAVDEFIKYTKEFDLTNFNIKRKQEHSLRVMNISNRLARSINLSEERINVATLIGLLHDIGRFEQYTQYKTFHDKISFDHGDYGVEILNKDIRRYIETDKYDKIIKNAVKNHNKFAIEDGLDEGTLMYSKLVRDADKIDIIYEWVDIFYKENYKEVESATIDDKLFEEFKKKKLIKRDNSVNYTSVEHLVTTIAFIFDLNFSESYKILKENDYINKIMNRFNFKNEDTNKKMQEIRKIANEYIEEKLCRKNAQFDL